MCHLQSRGRLEQTSSILFPDGGDQPGSTQCTLIAHLYVRCHNVSAAQQMLSTNHYSYVGMAKFTILEGDSFIE